MFYWNTQLPHATHVLIDIKVKYIDMIDIWYKPYTDF